MLVLPFPIPGAQEINPTTRLALAGPPLVKVREHGFQLRFCCDFRVRRLGGETIAPPSRALYLTDTASRDVYSAVTAQLP